jgi:hypothetical protein
VTPILQRGDKIHLAFGLSGNLTPPEAFFEAQKAITTIKENYREQGVEIVEWTANTGLTHPVVVAIFRNPHPGVGD